MVAPLNSVQNTFGWLWVVVGRHGWAWVGIGGHGGDFMQNFSKYF